MYKILNFIYLLVILSFFLNIFSYYTSDKNIKNTHLNRSDIDNTLKDKISDLPLLVDDTNNIIEFNSSFSNEIKDNELRNFWNLLKSK